MVAARDAVRVLALYEYETVPLSIPVELVVSQAALLAALQPQPEMQGDLLVSARQDGNPASKQTSKYRT